MDLAEDIRRTVEEKLTPAQFIVDVIVSARKGPTKISVILDGDNGVSIDDCAEISRQLSSWLDARDVIESNYLLEVSSPGVDQPLKLRRQYVRNIGRKLKVTSDGKVFEGKLVDVPGDSILLEQEVGKGKNREVTRMEFPLQAIEKAFVQISFK